MDQAFN